jgi:hypothetical protein
MQQNPCEKCCVGNGFTSNKCGETMDAEINNVIYMELYSEAKMMDDEYYKMNIARSIDRDSTVYTFA